MRRLIASLVAGCVAASLASPSIAADAQNRTSRVVEVPYQGPAAAASTPRGFITANCNPTYSIGCVRVPTRRSDRFAKIEIQDLAGQAVMAMVLDHSDNELAFFCGHTKRKLFVPPGSYLEVWLIAGTCDGTTTPSIVTLGTVRFTFSSS